MTFALAALLVLAASPHPNEGDISAAIADVAHVHPVPPELVRAIIQVESAGRPDAVSHAGAIGLMQVMPATARKVGIAPGELTVPARNILAGVRLLAVLLRYYDDALIDVLVAYNAGPRRPGAHVPANGETPAYVKRVLQILKSQAAVGVPADTSGDR